MNLAGSLLRDEPPSHKTTKKRRKDKKRKKLNKVKKRDGRKKRKGSNKDEIGKEAEIMLPAEEEKTICDGVAMVDYSTLVRLRGSTVTTSNSNGPNPNTTGIITTSN